MKKRLKGIVGTVVIVVLAAAVGFAGGVGFCMWLNNRGSGDGDAVQADVSVAETEETETETVTETVTELITTVQNAEYVEVVIDGDTYFYSGKFFALDELINEITKNGNNLEIRISFSDTATRFAYEELIQKLEENGIIYTEND